MTSRWQHLRATLGHLRQGLLDLTLPAVCLLCDEPLDEDQRDFCASCRAELFPDPGPTCPKCASTVGLYSDISAGCPRCRSQAWAFAGVIRLGRHEGKLRDAVLRIKTHPDPTLAAVLGRAWFAARREEFARCPAAAVVSLPLHWLRHWQRGCNQAALLAVALAQAWGKPLVRGVLWRRRWTAPQTSQSATQRRDAMKDAFAARLPPVWRGQTLLLVDDVLTTGATAHAAALALKKAGAKEVWVAVLSRGEGH